MQSGQNVDDQFSEGFTEVGSVHHSANPHWQPGEAISQRLCIGIIPSLLRLSGNTLIR